MESSLAKVTQLLNMQKKFKIQTLCDSHFSAVLHWFQAFKINIKLYM